MRAERRTGPLGFPASSLCARENARHRTHAIERTDALRPSSPPLPPSFQEPPRSPRRLGSSGCDTTLTETAWLLPLGPWTLSVESQRRAAWLACAARRARLAADACRGENTYAGICLARVLSIMHQYSMANANGAAQANGSRVGPSWLFRASRLHGPTIGGRARVPRPQQSTVLSFCRSVAHPVLLRGRSAEPRPLRMPSARGAARTALICCCSCVFADACPPLIRPQSASSHRGASQCVAGCDGGTGHAARCTGPDRVATFTRLLRPPPPFHIVLLGPWNLGTPRPGSLDRPGSHPHFPPGAWTRQCVHGPCDVFWSTRRWPSCDVRLQASRKRVFFGCPPPFSV